MRTIGQRIHMILVLLTILLICGSLFAPGVLADSTDSFLDDGFDEADDIYIDEDGNAVLVYAEDDANDDVEDLHLGGHVAEGILYLFATDSHAPDEFENVDMEASALLRGDVFEADGSLSLASPEEIDDLDVHLTGEVSDEANEMSLAAEAAFVDDSGTTAMAGEVQSSGDITIGHDTFALQADGTLVTDADPNSDTERYEVTIEDTETGYSAAVTQHEYVSSFESEEWSTEENATERLTDEVTPVAEELGGEATVDIDHYAYEERDDQDWLELEYTITMDGVKDGLSTMIANELAHDPELDLDEDQAEEIAAAVMAIDIETFDIQYADDGAELTVDVDIQIDAFDELAFAALDILEDEIAAGDHEVDGAEDIADLYEAQAETDMQTHITWDVAAESAPEHGAPTVIDAHMGYEVENWAAYVDALADRGIETTEHNLQFDMTVQDIDDEIHATGSFVFEQDDLIDMAMDQFVSMVAEDTEEQSAAEFVAILEETDLEVATIDVALAEQEVTIEAGTQVDDLEAFFAQSDIVPDSFVVDEPDGELYVHVTDVVDDPDAIEESDLESYSFVGPETQIHEPGDWDEQFPAFDLETAADYLDVQVSDTDENGDDTDDTDADDTTESDDDETDDTVPGFGVIAALVALLGSGLVRMYRTGAGSHWPRSIRA